MVNPSAAYGLYSQDVSLSDLVSNLNQAGFENEDICMMLSPKHPIASIVRDARFNTEKQTTAATAGLIGWISQLGAVLIPTVGFFVRSQIFFRSFMAKEGRGFCGSSKALIGLGFSDDDAERFEDRLSTSGVLVYVSCGEVAKTFWAREVLSHTGASEAATLHQRSSLAATA